MKITGPKWATLMLYGAAAILAWTHGAIGQDSRIDRIAAQQEEKSKKLQADLPDKVEQFITRMQKSGWLLSANPNGFYPYFDSVYSGGGLTLGAGYRHFYGDYSFAEVRGLYSFQNYKRIEFQTVSTGYASGRLGFDMKTGWMDATKIPYYGLGAKTTQDQETNFRLQETYLDGGATVKPFSWLHLRGGTGLNYYTDKEGTGLSPSIEKLYTPATAPGLHSTPSYVQSQVSVGIVTAPAEGYARRGGIYRYSFHDYRNVSGNMDSFQMSRTELVQHIPILRETWILSLRGQLESVVGSNPEVPYYLLPWLGSGSTLRGYGTGRFRDRNSMLFSGEWRWVPNRFFLDMALFYDAGTVAPQFKDLSFHQMKHDYGVGVRFHGPAVTALRMDVAHGSEGWAIIFAASAPF